MTTTDRTALSTSANSRFVATRRNCSAEVPCGAERITIVDASLPRRRARVPRIGATVTRARSFSPRTRVSSSSRPNAYTMARKIPATRPLPTMSRVFGEYGLAATSAEATVVMEIAGTLSELEGDNCSAVRAREAAMASAMAAARSGELFETEMSMMTVFRRMSAVTDPARSRAVVSSRNWAMTGFRTWGTCASWAKDCTWACV